MSYKLNNTTPELKLKQMVYNEVAKANKQMAVLVIPNQLIADATTEQLVGKGNLLRVKGASGTYLTFGPTGIAAPSISTANTIETPADFFFIIATDDFVRTSTAVRIEVTID